MFQVIDMHCDTIPALQWKEKQEHLADADLQINLCGSEYWEWTNRAEHTEVFNEQADVGFAAGIPGCGGQLGDGRFALFLPGEYHKPSCRSDSCAHVRKAVVKIEMA